MDSCPKIWRRAMPAAIFLGFIWSSLKQKREWAKRTLFLF
jgi:hypothetical protein